MTRKLTNEALDTIESALNHYLKYRVEYGRTTSEQLEMDEAHRLRVYNALEEIHAMRNKKDYGTLFGLTKLFPQDE